MPRALLYFILLFSSSSVWAHELVDSSEYVHIRNLTFEGNKITKEFVILREMNIAVGDSVIAYNLQEILEFNKTRMLNSKLFSKVEFEIARREGDSIDVIYTVNELFYWAAHPYIELADRNFNVWWYEMDRKLNRLNLGIDFDRKNFRGRNEEIGGEVQVGFNKHVYLYYSNPFIDKTLKHGMRAVASYNTGKEIHLATDSNKQVFYRNETQNPFQRFRLELSHLYRPRYAAMHETRLGFNHYSVTDSLMYEQPNFLGGKNKISYFELWYQFKYELTDDRNYAENGWELEFSASKKGLGIFNDINQTSFYTHIANYQQLSNRFSTAVHLRGRLSFPDKQPFFNNRAMGFKNDFLRGYEYYLMDGSHYGLVRGDVRYKFLDFAAKQKMIPILQYVPIKAYAKTYADAGYIRNMNPGNSFLNNRPLTSYGLGIDLVISYYVMIRIEYSFNQFGQNGLFLHGRKE
jgi:outer membrane protein assembly factor BamA